MVIIVKQQGEVIHILAGLNNFTETMPGYFLKTWSSLRIKLRPHLLQIT